MEGNIQVLLHLLVLLAHPLFLYAMLYDCAFTNSTHILEDYASAAQKHGAYRRET